ncbi:MAG: hypothetical protein U9N86_15355 [Bacteroidota bacterium]|nr:hypothetical protein [Bacteroidota bacterium]
MKRLFPVLLFLAVSASSCDSLNNRLTVKIQNEFSLEISFVKDTTDMSDWMAFQYDTTGSQYQDPSLDGYRETIQNIELKDLWIQVSGLSQEIELRDVRIQLVSDTHNCLWEFGDQVWYKDYSLTLEDINGQWDIVGQILNDHAELSFYLTGEVEKEKEVLDFVISLVIATEITAED